MPATSQIPIASANQVRRFARWLSFFYGTTFGLGGTYLPFFPVWLKAIGIDPSWIGMIAAAPAVTRFTVLPFVTGFAERHRAVRGAMIATAFATAAGFIVIGTQHAPLVVFLLFALTASVWTPMVPLTDAYALRGVAHYGLDYGPLRLWGSVALSWARWCAGYWSISSRPGT
jgi:PPP family 3-phenylpropionic acid transporter